MNIRNFIVLICLFLTFEIKQGWATTILIQHFEDVIKESPLIIEATVKKIEFYIIPNSALGYATVTLSVQDIMNGSCPNEILVRRYGVNDRFEYLDTEYAPVYIAQNRYIICLKKHPQGYYKPLGLLNGSFKIENGIIAGRGVSEKEFKQLIKDILNDVKYNSSSKIQELINTLKKENSANVITSAGSHMGGQFATFNETWNTNYFPVKFYYNPDGASADISTVIERINNAFTPWNNLSLSALDFQTITTSDITSQKQVQNTTNVIFWTDWWPNVLAEEFPYPNPPQSNGTKRGTDILFNTDYNTGSKMWYFGSTPLSNRQGNYDFADILVHELGHSQGLAHTNINSTRMVSGYSNCSVSPLRTIADGDKAGAVYQHTGFTNIPTTFPHSIAISATTTNFNITENVTVGSGKTFEIDPGITITTNSGKKLTVNGVISATGTSSQKITFQASSGTWSGIELNYCTIKNATCGIRAYHTSPLYVENCTIENNSNGLTFDNQSAGYVRYS